MSIFPEMTPELKHSLLLEKITAPKVIAYLKYEDGELTTEKTDEWGTAHLWSALRAVVELHKPDIRKTDDALVGWCRGCEITNVGGQPYPCPTIQAIQEQLK